MWDMMTQYDEHMRFIMDRGERRVDRTKVGTAARIDIPTMVFPLHTSQFPVVTRRHVPFRMIAAELVCFIRGYTNLRDFHRLGVSVWDANAHAAFWKAKAAEWGDLGRIYGWQWRRQGEPGGHQVDQLHKAIWSIKHDPYSRRIIIDTWNAVDIDRGLMCLEPCHGVPIQFYVDGAGRVCVRMNQRSADWFLGVAFNIPSYALLTHLVARAVGREPGVLVVNTGDSHVYENHRAAVGEYLRQRPRPLPFLRWNNKLKVVYDLEPESAELAGYEHGPRISAPMAVGDRQMIISLIVARDKSGVIGRGEGELPWPRIQRDMGHFVRVTTGRPESANTVVMGRKTRESVVKDLGHDLPERATIVLTRDPHYAVPEGVHTASSLTAALLKARELAREVTTDERVPLEVVIAGGESVYREALPRADRIYLTEVDGEFEGDRYFPKFDGSEWREALRSPNYSARGSVPGFYWRVLDRAGTRWPEPQLRL